MSFDTLLNNLKLDKIRNIIIYASFITLIISLLFPLVSISNSVVQKASFIFLLYGLSLWVIEHIFNIIISDTSYDAQYLPAVAWIILAIIGFILSLDFALKINLIEVIFSR